MKDLRRNFNREKRKQKAFRVEGGDSMHESRRCEWQLLTTLVRVLSLTAKEGGKGLPCFLPFPGEEP